MKFENRIESTSFFLLPCVTILSARRIIPLVESRVDRYREEISDFFLSIKSSKAVIFEEREKKGTNKNFDSYFFAYTSNLSGCYETVSSRMINNFLSKVLIIRKARPLKLTSFSQRQILKGRGNARLSFNSFIRLFISPLETLLRIK